MQTKHVISPPESASKREYPTHRSRRGRKSNKIINALLSAPTTPVPVEAFMAEHDVSLPVLRQAKRFAEAADPETAAKIGTVRVRQNRITRELMIWKEL